MRVRLALALLLPGFVLLASLATARGEPAPPVRPVAEVVAAVDEGLIAAWTEEGREPGPPATDAAFCRRATLDLAGRLPAAGEVRAFLADTSPDKDAALVDRLLDDPTAAIHHGELAARRLLGRDDVPLEHRRALEDWLAEQWRKDRGWDAVAFDLVTATGEIPENGAAAYAYQFATDVPALAGRTARLFLGVRIECAQCHDHPFDRWKESDFHAFASFFTQVRRQKVPTPVDTANGLLARAKRQEGKDGQALQALEKELAAAEASAKKTAKTRADAEKAAGPVRQAIQKLEKPWKAAVERAKEMDAVAARAAALRKTLEARLAGPLSDRAKRTAGEQAKLAADLAVLSAEQAKSAATSRDEWKKRLDAERARAKPLLDRLQAATTADEAAKRRVGEAKAALEAARQAKALDDEIRGVAHDLAGIEPAVYADAYASKKERVPPPVYRVLDAGGKVRPHPDKAEPEKGDGLPRTLGGAPVKAGSDAAKLRGTLATWMTAHANPWLAKAAVNRAAARLLGRAFITPADDLTGPGERFAEPVLDLLAQDFEASGYDLHRLERILARTRAYRLASADGEEKADLVTMPVRELPPTVAFRALVQAALPGLADAKEGGPRGLRENNVRRFAVYFDDGLDRPRTQSQGGIQRALWMLNGEPAGDLLRDRKEGLARRIVGANLSTEKAVEEVYLTVLGRLPDDGEERIARAALPAQPEKARVEAIEDLEWALMNGGEFLVNR